VPVSNPHRVRRLLPYAAVGLAACGGSSSHKVASAPVAPPTHIQTQTATATTSTSTTAAATTPTTSAGAPPCRASDLVLSFLGGQGATGHGELGFAIKNTSSAPCHTFGYPGVQFLDRSGAALPTVPSHTTHDYFGTAPEERLIVEPGQSVSFRLGVTHGASGIAGCATAYSLQVIPPDDTATLKTSISDGAFECRTVSVSPLRPGVTAYP
jgi:hypothetical protein